VSAKSHQVLEKGLGTEVGIVLLGEGSLNVDGLEGAQLKSSALEARDDLSHKSALRRAGIGRRFDERILREHQHLVDRSRRRPIYLNAVGLDHDVAPLVL
jgi:hypothetical protein